MKIVVDTNVLFSFFWDDSITRKLLLTSSLGLISPEYALEEVRKYKAEIIKKTNIRNKKFEEYLYELRSILEFINRNEYSDCLEEAKKISPDEKDSEFFALCLKENCSLWTNDITLKRQDKIKVLTTKDIIMLL